MNITNYDEPDGSSTSLSMIDCAIKSLRDIPVKYNLTSINLHSNLIAKMENLIYLQNLAHLDLSSNRIVKIDGLSGLVSLKTLNLSCNSIASIENLDGLKQLTHLNLSYNKIQYVNGLNDLWGRDYHIETIVLHSNFISSLEEVSYYLSGLVRLRHLTLSENKFLKNVDYRVYILTNLKSLISLDGKDRFNKKVNYKASSSAASIGNDFGEFIEWQQQNEPDHHHSHRHHENSKPNKKAAASFHLTSASINSSKDNETSMSSLGPKLDVIEDKIHSLLKIRDKIRHNLSGEDSDEDDEIDEYAKAKYNESSIKKMSTLSRKDEQKQTVSRKHQAPKSILKSPVQFKNTSLSDLSNNNNNSSTTTQTSSSIDTSSNLNDLIKLLQEQLNGFKHSQDENLKLIANLKEALESSTRDREKCVGEKEAELTKEKDFNKLLVKELDELRAKSEYGEKKLKQYEAKTAKYVTQKEEKLKSAHQNELTSLKCKLESARKETSEKCGLLEAKYRELEDEFRSALLIESTRFNELFQKYERVSQEFSSVKTELAKSEQSETRSQSLIKELNELIKEQKSKIQQLSKIRKDTSEDVQKRNVKLNEAVSDCVKLKAHCEELKREKRAIEVAFKRLALEAEDIKSEKGAWTAKMNEQKSFYMQENNRLEIENKQMRGELEALTANHARESDQCKIKTKVIEDQTETIKKLKAALVERDDMLKKSREEALHTQKSLEKQLNDEMDLSNELQLKFEKATERKESLKMELEQCRMSLDETKLAYDELVDKWRQKSDLITELEVRVKKMKESFEAKEREHSEKNAQLIEENAELMAKLRKCDDDFRLQYDVERREHLKQLERVRLEYEAKLVDGENRVKDIEDEMRLVLIESEKKKQFYEEKINSFSQMFSKFQSEIKQDR
jgi:leucine-rich repeat/coiled-coil domain-containing protein 1